MRKDEITHQNARWRDAARRSVRVGDLTMRWIEQGSGDPVIFLHGIPTGPALWRHVLSRLPERRCLAWEMVGYGGSMFDGIGRDLSLSAQAGYLVKWMEALNIEDAVLVGHDLGGGVAQIAAVRHPRRVRGLVLTNCVGYDAWPVPSVRFLRALSPLLARSPDVAVRMIQLILFLRGHDSVPRALEALRVHWSPYAAADATRALVRQIKALDAQDTLAVADDLRRQRLPAAIVWGAADRFLKLPLGERLAHDLKAPIDRIDGGKHFVPEDHPGRVAAAVQRVDVRP